MARVLVPMAVLEGESVPLGLMDLLGTMDVTVLGYHVLPEQTPPDQARLQYEDRANEALEDVAEEFRKAGGDADYRLVFTQNRQQSITRVAAEIEATAHAILGATGEVDRLLVTLGGVTEVELILDFVRELVGDRPIGVTLFLAVGDQPEAEVVDRLESAATALEEAGIDVTTHVASKGAPFDALIEAVTNHDAIVMGEQATTLRSVLFGDESERIAAESVGPVLVVRQQIDEESSGETP